MKIQFASDLHLEFRENREYLKTHPLRVAGDILILAGDISPFYKMHEHRDFFTFCSDHFHATYWIPGNHEFYHDDLNNNIGTFTEEVAPNVFLVNNHILLLENARIIFSTLWTRISDQNAPPIQEFLYDYKLIRDGDSLFDTHRCNALFLENSGFIKDAVRNNEEEICIVVTHHVPTFTQYPEEYRNSPLNEGFAVEMKPFIESSPIDYWIYGHHHRNVPDFTLGETRLITNQLGYVREEEHHTFQPDRFIEV